MEYKAFLIKGKTKKEVALTPEEVKGNHVVTLSADEVGSGYDYIDFLPDSFEADGKDEGYFIISDIGWSRLVRFSEQGLDGHYDSNRLSMLLFGFLKNGIGTVGFITGMRHDYHLVCGRKDGHYYYFLRFPLEGRAPYEDISITLHTLEGKDADYSGMARWYRDFGLENGYFTTLSEKMEALPLVKYASESINIRVRMGWKPAPATVLEQTRENEPPMYAACTFKKVEELIDELKAAGVEKADICLVGWNVKGHDGRWPEMFPVEPAFGGEEGLKHLLKKAKEAGYILGLHTNFTDAYTIAQDFSADYIIKKPDGSLEYDETCWSGGRMYHVALPYRKKEYLEDLKRLKEIGDFGMHYSDVISISAPRRSYDPERPMSPYDFCQCSDEVFKELRELFGAASSEGGVEHYLKNLDYILYICFSPEKYYENEKWMNETIPLWSLVFHGTVLYNATSHTINYIVKDKSEHMRVLEYGGKPAAACNSSFRTGNNAPDLPLRENESPKAIALKIAEMYKHYKETLMPLQTTFIERHDFLDDGSSAVTYCDGTRIVVNYESGEFKIEKNTN